MVPDGATIVIGGLMDSEDNRMQQGLPILGDLPWIGVLFRQRQHSGTKRELVVLLTPRIWNPSLPHGPECDPIIPASAVQAEGPNPPPSKSEASPLTVRVQERPGSVQVGQEVLYEMNITNQSQKAVQNVAVAVSLPPGLNPAKAEGPAGYDLKQQQVLFQPLGTLEPQAQAIYRVQANALLSGPQRIRIRISSPSLLESLEVEGETQVLPLTGPGTKPAAGVPGALPRS
jgi:uncharacterized repeat protein (TIGR01451 family)